MYQKSAYHDDPLEVISIQENDRTRWWRLDLCSHTSLALDATPVENSQDFEALDGS